MSFYSVDQFIREHYPQYWGYETYPQDRCVCIRKVSDEWGILCNFAPTPLVVNGVEFKSSEELFQMMKFKDPAVVSNITKGVTSKGKRCYEIKKTAKSYEKEFRRENWGSMVVDAMKFCLQKKYEQCSAFREKLHESHGRFIVEDQTTWRKKKPDAWGVKPDGDNVTGPNLLGRLLMELREIGKLEYTLPDDAFEFISVLKECNK